MKCPKCNNGDIVTDTYVLKNGCPHCDGTGEIKEGDWWIDDNYMVCILYEGEWMRTNESIYIPVLDFKPIARMKEVK